MCVGVYLQLSQFGTGLVESEHYCTALLILSTINPTALLMKAGTGVVDHYNTTGYQI